MVDKVAEGAAKAGAGSVVEEWAAADDGGVSGGGGRGSGHGGGGTLLYDAVYLAGEDLMSKQQGRKALIILSDGVDHGSKVGITTAIETAQRADTVVYSILFKDDEGFGESRLDFDGAVRNGAARWRKRSAGSAG